MSLVVLNSEAIDSCIRSMAASICAREGDAPIAIVGIRRGGEHLAQRLAREVEKVSGTLPPLGMVDITLYRDDGFGRSEFRGRCDRFTVRHQNAHRHLDR